MVFGLGYLRIWVNPLNYIIYHTIIQFFICFCNFPAWVCTQYGEPLFEENEVKHIQNALRKFDKEAEMLSFKSAS